VMSVTGGASDDEAECRICRGGEESQRPLFYPCKCSGSIKYTHEDCLLNWLAQSGTARCELCNFSFRFEPLYEPNTPRALATDELVLGLLARARSSIFTFVRVLLVLFVWLFVLPLGTCWTWYALFISSLSQFPSLVGGRGLSGVVTDAFYGCLLSAGIVFVFLGVSSLREYIRHLPEDGGDANMFLDDLADIDHLDLHNHDDVDAQDDELPLVDIGRDEGPADLIDVDTVSDDDGIEILLPVGGVDGDAEKAVSGSSGEPATDLVDVVGRAEEDWDDEDALYDDDLPALEYSDEGEFSEVDTVEANEADDPPLHDGEYEHVQNGGHMQGGGNHPGEVDDGGALFGLFELDPEEVPLEEMVGLRGNIRSLFDNAGTVLVSNAIFLGIFTLIPLLVGRMALRVASLSALPLNESSSATLGSTLNATATVLTVGGETPFFTLASGRSAVAGDALKRGMDSKEPLVSYADNLLVVLLGYGVISVCAVIYVAANSLLRSRYPRFDTPMTRQVARVLRYLATFVKIVVLIVFEFGIFPLGCGWWLDLCTLRILNSSVSSRTAFCREFPSTCTIGHWFVGIFYMVHVSMLVSHLREILRPQLLWFLRNPDDPDFRPFRELVEKPLSRHARRMCLSSLIYGPLILACVYVPSELCLGLLPDVFPLNFSDFSHTLVEVPFANVLALPLVSLVHHTQAGRFARIALKVWTERVAYALGIEDVVLRVELRGGDADNVAPNVGFAEQRWNANHRHQGHDPGDGNEDEADLFAPFDDDDLGYRNGLETADMNGTRDGITSVDASQTLQEHSRALNVVWVRGVFMLFLAWVTLVACACLTLTAPPAFGRYVMKVVGVASPHDLHAVGLGIYLILGLAEGGFRIYNMLASVDAQTAIQLAVPYIVASLKSISLAFVWLGVVSLGAGLLAELVVTIPFRVGHNESPFFYLHQDWALGFLLVKVSTRIVLAGGFTAEWRDRLARAREGGFFGIGEHFERTWREVVAPVLWGQILALAAPYALTQGLLPALGASRLLSSIVHRYVYIWMLSMYIALVAFEKCKSGLYALHDSIRDDKYLVGKKLYNWEARALSAELERTRWG
jgi:hypothetical protein